MIKFEPLNENTKNKIMLKKMRLYANNEIKI